MNGSGSSGSAVPHYFIWNGTKFGEQTPAPPSLVSSINNAPVASAPWGFVDSKGNWVLGDLLRFGFAEASVKLSEAFPNFEPCNNADPAACGPPRPRPDLFRGFRPGDGEEGHRGRSVNRSFIQRAKATGFPGGLGH